MNLHDQSHELAHRFTLSTRVNRSGSPLYMERAEVVDLIRKDPNAVVLGAMVHALLAVVPGNGAMFADDFLRAMTVRSDFISLRLPVIVALQDAQRALQRFKDVEAVRSALDSVSDVLDRVSKAD